MIDAALHLLLYALIAGFSAVTFAATLAVMQAGRLKTLGFGVGFVIGQVLTCSLLVGFGVVVTGASRRTHSALLATLGLLFALLLIGAALRSDGHLRSRRKGRATHAGAARAARSHAFAHGIDRRRPARDRRPEAPGARCACRHGDHHRRRWGCGRSRTGRLVLRAGHGPGLGTGHGLRAPRRPSHRSHDARPAGGRTSSSRE